MDVYPGRTFTAQTYRYAYQGSEQAPEYNSAGGNVYTTFFRTLDSRLGRWFTPDVVSQPWQSPYCSMDNNPVVLVDPWGAESDVPEGHSVNDGVLYNEQGEAVSQWINTVEVSPKNNIYVGSFDPGKMVFDKIKRQIAEEEFQQIERKYSGTTMYPEPEETVAKPIKELSGGIKLLKGITKIAKYFPFLSDIKKFNDIAQDDLDLSTNNPADLIPLPGSSTANSALKSLISEDAIEDFENQSIHGKIKELNRTTDYDKFASQVNNHNENLSNTSGQTIVIIYTDEDVNPGDVLYSSKGLRPTFYARYSYDFEIGEEYNGWKPKYAVFGIKSEFTGKTLIIRGKIKINH